MKDNKNAVHLDWNDKSEKNYVSDAINFKTLEIVYPNPVRKNEFKIQENELDKKISLNRLLKGNNLNIMQALLKDLYRNKIDLIYIDPPYLSKLNYASNLIIKRKNEQYIIKRDAFQDTWKGGIDDYLNMIYPRLLLMKDLLSEQGNIFVHLDWHVSHYVKILMDEVFGMENFINEIVWCYSGGSPAKRHFSRKHDIILWYAKSEKYIFNPQHRPYSQKTIERGLTKVKGDKYKLHSEGAIMQDWWTDINKILSPTAKENLKYPTQKPEKLLERIIKAASNEGSLVADFFAGSATLAKVCDSLNRNWIIADNSQLAIEVSRLRLIKAKSSAFSIEEIYSKDKEVTKDKENTNKTADILAKAYYYLEKGVYYLKLSLDNYYSADINDSEQNNFINFIEFWDIDLEYNDEYFSSHIQISRDKSEDELVAEISISLIRPSQRKIAIRVHDVFGHSQIQSLELEGISDSFSIS